MSLNVTDLFIFVLATSAYMYCHETQALTFFRIDGYTVANPESVIYRAGMQSHIAHTSTVFRRQ
jgi:hypothetical protein